MMTELSTIVHVVWHDAHSVGTGWHNPDTIEDVPCVVHTVGYLMTGAKDGHVVVAQSFTDDGDVDHVLAIPVGMVKSMTVCG